MPKTLQIDLTQRELATVIAAVDTMRGSYRLFGPDLPQKDKEAIRDLESASQKLTAAFEKSMRGLTDGR
jgi:hypothetical protein